MRFFDFEIFLLSVRTVAFLLFAVAFLGAVADLAAVRPETVFLVLPAALGEVFLAVAVDFTVLAVDFAFLAVDFAVLALDLTAWFLLRDFVGFLVF